MPLNKIFLKSSVVEVIKIWPQTYQTRQELWNRREEFTARECIYTPGSQPPLIPGMQPVLLIAWARLNGLSLFHSARPRSLALSPRDTAYDVIFTSFLRNGCARPTVYFYKKFVSRIFLRKNRMNNIFSNFIRGPSSARPLSTCECYNYGHKFSTVTVLSIKKSVQ